MPPNPRDGTRLTADGKVPLKGVENVVADSLAEAFPGQPVLRDGLAEIVVRRLVRYHLLAADVEIPEVD